MTAQMTPSTRAGATDRSSSQCPGADIVLSSSGALPPCDGLADLVAAGTPLAVLSMQPRSGAGLASYEAIDALAQRNGRGSLLVHLKVRVADDPDRSWRSTLHSRPVVGIDNAAALRTLCATGVVAVCAVDELSCVDSTGTAVGTVDATSLAAAVHDAVNPLASDGAEAALGPDEPSAQDIRVCSSFCPSLHADGHTRD